MGSLTPIIPHVFVSTNTYNCGIDDDQVAWYTQTKDLNVSPLRRVYLYVKMR